MCGIAGVVDLQGRIGKDTLAALARRMAAAMPYRGPDDSGVWVSDDGRCALAHQRLSIIDTSAAGHQPFVVPEGDGVITFNGEIYNFLELREELAATGHRFRTRTDTEVLAALLRDHGASALERLDGQFAFGFYRPVARRLLLARDPFGEKPLYWCQTGDLFAFASELHALTLVPGFDCDIDQDTVAEYLALQYVDAPRTIYRGAHKLRPGHWLRLDAGGHVETSRHFTFEPRGPETGNRRIEELAEELEAILLRMVRRRMIADVPLGAFLSGGVDSSTVVALMTRVLGGQVKTFSIGFDGTEETEHLLAAQMAQHLGTEHREQVLKLDVLDLLLHIGKVLDEPNGDSSCLPTFLVSRLARQHVTVSLSGDGGDELFGGYGRYFHTLQEQAAAEAGDPSQAHWDAGNAYWSGRSLVFLDAQLEALFGKVPVRTAAVLAQLRAETRGPGNLLHRMRRLDVEHYLPGAVLPKVDRMSMQHSLEVRTPFLSRDVARFCEQLPVDAMYRKGQGKLVLKQLAQRYVPRAWLDRRKMGFGVPVQTVWGRERMNGWLQELLLGKDARLAQWIEPAARAAFVSGSQRSFSFYQAWLMLVLETWLRSHAGRRCESPEAVPVVITREPEPWEFEDFGLWAWLHARQQPVILFHDGALPRSACHLPAGSAVVGVEPCRVPQGVSKVDMAWRCGPDAPDLAALAQLPPGIAVFPCHIAGVHRLLVDRLEFDRRTFVHRFEGRWCHAEMSEEVVAQLMPRRAARRLGLLERTRSVSLPVQSAQHEGGHCYRVPAPALARAAAQGKQVVLYEDGVELRRGPSTPEAIRSLGRGRNRLQGEDLLFASSDNTAPVSNHRRYQALCRGGNGGPGLLAPLQRLPGAWLALGVFEGMQRWLQPAGTPDERRLRPPFVHDDGCCWRTPIRRMLIPAARLEQGLRLLLCEDGVPLPLADIPHEEIRRKGGGRYSIWDGWVFFSASDGSDPNRNGRTYTVQLLPPVEETAMRAAASGQGNLLRPRFSDAAAFQAALAERIATDRPEPRARLEPPAAVSLLIGTLGAGGTERQQSNLALELDRRGFTASIMCLAGMHGGGAHYRKLLAGTRGLRVIAADRLHPAFAPESLDTGATDLLASLPEEVRDDVFRLCSHIQQLRPEVLHCSLDPTNIAGGIAGLLMGVPRIVLGVRSVNPSWFPHLFRPHFAGYYQLLARSSRVRLCANSHAGARDYAEWLGLPERAFTVVHNGLDEQSLTWPDDAAVAALREEHGIAAGVPVLAGVLRFSAEKRPLVFLEVCARLRELVPGLRVLLVGSGDMEQKVEAKVRKLDLAGTVTLLGRRHDVPAVMRAADALLLVSHMEGLPNVLLEAQHFGRPVVSTRVGGAPECMSEGQTGFLRERDDVQGLAEACARLLRDRELAGRMGQAGAAFVAREFSLAHMVDATLGLYS